MTEQTPGPAPVRRVLLLAHTGREEAREVARAFVKALSSNDIRVRALHEEAADLALDPDLLEIADDETLAAADCELALVLGGDGTILRAAEITHGHGTPLLGVNLGHVGFLAEAEPDAVESTVAAIVERRYTAEQRLTIDVTVHRDGELVASTFALNEASVEKAARERMLEVVVEIDGRPLSRFGCDGVVCATPTGSTAYNLSAGGPILHPLLPVSVLTPICPHTLTLRPLVVPDTSVIEVEIETRDDAPESRADRVYLTVDGQEGGEIGFGDRVRVTRASQPAYLVRTGERSSIFEGLRNKLHWGE